MKATTGLNCSVGIATSRLVAKIASDQAKPNGILSVMPGVEANFLAPLEVRRIPGVGKVTEKNLQAIGIRRIGDLAELEEKDLEARFGKWGLALAGKSKGLDAGGWFDTEVGERDDPKSISHEHTFNTDTRDTGQVEATLAHLAEKVGRRLQRTRTLRPHSPVETPLLRFHDHHPSALAARADPNRYRSDRALPPPPPRQLGPKAGDPPHRSSRLRLHRRTGAAEFDRRRPGRTVASGTRSNR